MMRMSSMSNVLQKMDGVLGGGVGGGGRAEGENKEWELRPGGMLVQTRADADQNHAPPPTIRVRVKHGSIYHEIRISSQASFGELKKMLSGPTGLHHHDQKLYYKDKERDSNTFLDRVGVKDKSKITLVEDDISKEKRYIEMKKTAKMEKSAKSISDISLEVDRLARKVSALESIVSKGGKVVENDLVDLIELLMNQLLKLDGISVDGDVRLQRKMQVTRVQKCVETLDVLKIKNSMHPSNGKDAPLHSPSPSSSPSPSPSPSLTQQHQQQKHSNGHTYSLSPQKHSNGSDSSLVQQHRHSFVHSSSDSPKNQQPQPSRHSVSGAAVVVTTQWETFDSSPAPPASGALPSSSATARTIHTPQPSFTWDLL